MKHLFGNYSEKNFDHWAWLFLFLFFAGVSRVFFGSDFVTVTKAEDFTWDLLKPEVFAAIMDFYTSSQPLFYDAKTPSPSDTAIKEVLHVLCLQYSDDNMFSQDPNVLFFEYALFFECILQSTSALLLRS